MSRLNRDGYYLNIASAVSEGSTCLRRRYGAVIVKNDEIIATGYNGAPRGEQEFLEAGVCERNRLGIKKGERYELCKAVHAEQNAIISASRRDMVGATMYIAGYESETGEIANPEPCDICRKLIKNAGIKKVIGLSRDSGETSSAIVFNM